MQILYQPGLASGNCYLVPLTGIGVTLAGLIVLLLLLPRFIPCASPHFRTMAGVVLFVPVIILGTLVYSVAAGRESIVRIAVDGSDLEYRYCRRLDLKIERHSLASLVSADYRQERERRRSGVTRIDHFLDISFAGRAKPISIRLGDSSSELDLELAETIAPAAVRQYRRAVAQ